MTIYRNKTNEKAHKRIIRNWKIVIITMIVVIASIPTTRKYDNIVKRNMKNKKTEFMTPAPNSTNRILSDKAVKIINDTARINKNSWYWFNDMVRGLGK
ncbi:MAG: hypothetical protein LBL75_01535 [Rickettsiales bacterium]|jgi:hypothetical protein|nr:hypothetical protein [Rickettsiales bacterium]